MIENPDGSITIPMAEVYAVDDLDQRLSGLGVRARALRADASCETRVEEVDWGDVYARVVPENGPDPWITIQPSAIPADTTLLLVSQQIAGAPRQQGPDAAVRLMLVPNPAPGRIGQVFHPPKPPPPVDQP